MEVQGKLLDILPAQTGKSAKGEWKKQDFIIETEDQFPKKICIANWNDKINIESLSKGTLVSVSVNIESREFNGKWYTDVKAWRLETANQAAAAQSVSSDMPPPPPPPSADDANWSDGDDVNDLPF